MTVPIIEASSISKRFGSHTVLDRLDCRVEPGQVIGLLGRHGAGKSTLLECLLGLRETDAGTVTLYGENAASLSEAARAKIGYVPQRPDLFEWLTPIQMLAYFKALYPCWNGPRVDGLLGRWGFDARTCNKPIGMLPGGEKQRLSIIRALAHDPELLILDEPVSALDPVGRREFLCELIDGVIDCGTTVVFSTHILSDLERVASDIAFLKDGRIALHGEMDALLEGARRVTAPASMLAGVTLEGELRRTDEPGGRTSVVTRVAGGDALALAARDSEVRVDALSLEDLFIEVTR